MTAVPGRDGRKRRIAVLGSALFLVLVPGTVAGLLPYWISRWELQPAVRGVWSLRPVGVVLLAIGAAGLLDCFARFAVHGRGTPSPTFPTERLVTVGLYRFVRNPMYVAVLLVIAGQALLLRSGQLLLYAGTVWLFFHAFVLLYEEPVLAQRFGASYRTYRRHVRRWWPRLSPWRESTGGDRDRHQPSPRSPAPR